MSIWLKIFGPELKGYKIKCAYMDYDTRNDKLPYSKSHRETHIICITYKHPILRELGYHGIFDHDETDENHPPDTSRHCTELVGGKGIGKSVEKNRGTTEAFSTLAGLIHAYWDYHEMGLALLKVPREDLDKREGKLKRPSPYQTVSLPELHKIRVERKEPQDRQKELENRMQVYYRCIKEYYRCLKERYRCRQQ